MDPISIRSTISVPLLQPERDGRNLKLVTITNYLAFGPLYLQLKHKYVFSRLILDKEQS